VLLAQQLGEPPALDLDQIAVATRIEKVHQGPDKEAAVGAKHDAVVIGRLGQKLLHELDDPVAGVGAAGRQPRLKNLCGVGAPSGRGPQWAWLRRLKSTPTRKPKMIAMAMASRPYRAPCRRAKVARNAGRPTM